MCVLAHWRGNISAQVYINPYCSLYSFLVKHVLTPFLPHGHNPFYGYLSQYMCIGHKSTAVTPYILLFWAINLGYVGTGILDWSPFIDNRGTWKPFYYFWCFGQ